MNSSPEFHNYIELFEFFFFSQRIELSSCKHVVAWAVNFELKKITGKMRLRFKNLFHSSTSPLFEQLFLWVTKQELVINGCAKWAM